MIFEYQALPVLTTTNISNKTSNPTGTKEALDDLVQTLEEASAQNGYTASMVDAITKAIAQMDLDHHHNHNHTSSVNRDG